jgi:hypothetical protein
VSLRQERNVGIVKHKRGTVTDVSQYQQRRRQRLIRRRRNTGHERRAHAADHREPDEEELPARAVVCERAHSNENNALRDDAHTNVIRKKRRAEKVAVQNWGEHDEGAGYERRIRPIVYVPRKPLAGG